MTINSTPQEPPSITGQIGAGGKRVLDSIVNLLASLRVHPNILTLIGMVINIFAMILFAEGIFIWGALVILFAGIFDIVDGEVARRTKRVTKFGAFFDSVIDRYSDLLLLLGLIIWYAKINRIFYVGLTGLVLIGSVLTSYTRARAESLIPACKVGFLERPERIVLLIIGGVTDRMAAVLWVMAILSNWTVSQRIWYTWRELRTSMWFQRLFLCAYSRITNDWADSLGGFAPPSGARRLARGTFFAYPWANLLARLRRAQTHIFRTRTSFGSLRLKTDSGILGLILTSENFRIM
ncbi:MAG: hypothetical protein DMG14_05680 [Acidobacteria bacterium]|nr:MAG: hypothetical protein DMG14_05680 [Acidobacteriota bacterium]